MSVLDELLQESRHWGYLGPGPLKPQIEHARAFALGVEAPERALDLGSGGGLPGLVLADLWPDSSWVLLDSNLRRTEFLYEAVLRLGWEARVTVVRSRAEEAGRDATFRSQQDLVVARSFAPPGPTAECSAPLLKVGGHLVVSEPPTQTEDRWPSTRLAELGLRLDQLSEGPPRMVRLVQESLCPERFPRAVGKPTKRPLF